MRIVSKIVEYHFGFSECRRCENKDVCCDHKPYLHTDNKCHYRIEHGGITTYGDCEIRRNKPELMISLDKLDFIDNLKVSKKRRLWILVGE